MPSYVLKKRKSRTKKINTKVVGSFAKIDKGIASGFSAGNYLSLPETFTIGASDSFEIVVSFVHKTQSSVGYILGASTDVTLGIIVNSNNTLKVNAGNGSSWYGDIFGSTVLTSGVKYWVKLVRDTSGWYLYLSTDGKEYNLEKNNTWSGAPRSTNIYIGNVYGNTPFLGQSIDITQSYININGERWWSGDSYTKVGSWIDYDKFVASGFSTANYLTYPEVADVNGNWEAVLKLRTEVTPPDSSIFSFPNNNNFGCQLNVSGGKFLFVWNHIPGNRWDIYDTGVVIPVNKDVWVKYTKAGAIFKLYTSDDGLTYTEVASREYTATLYTPNTGFSLGGAVNNQVAWNGSIDLNESYIKINGELWWSGTHYVPDDKSYILKRKINKYYKDTVTTKYWKEVETTVNGVAYACYYGMPSQGIMSPYIYYVKTPLGSDTTLYYYSEWDAGDAFPSYATDVSQLSPSDFGYTLSSVTETTMTFSNVTLTRQFEHDLYADIPATTVVEGTPDDYTYTTTETESVEVSADDDYDRVVADSEPAYFLTQRGNWQPVYEDYTLPKMTSRTAPEGAVSTNIGNGEYTIDAYNFFFNRSWYFEAEGREGSRYNRYTFAKPLKPDTYTISFGGNLQQQDSNSGTLSVWYDDGTIETLITYTLSTAGQTFSKTFTATKPIRTISIDMTVGRRDNKNDVTTFYGLNIVSETGQLQVFTGYKQDKE